MANVDIKLGYKDSAWFTANATLVLKVGQIVYLEQTGTYKLGDGVTQLSALSFLGGSQDLQSVLANDNKTGGSNIVISLGDLIKDISGVNYIDIQQAGVVEFGTTNGYFFIDASKSEISHSVKNVFSSPLHEFDNIVKLSGLTPSQSVETDANKNLVSVTHYTESFAYTGSPFTLTVAPNYIFSIRTTSMVLDESDINDVTIVGTTLTVINPAFQSGETLYIKYKG